LCTQRISSESVAILKARLGIRKVQRILLKVEFINRREIAVKQRENSEEKQGSLAKTRS